MIPRLEEGEEVKPRLLDLFCGAGGAAMGYARAGFEVVGIDCKPQPRYPFEFIQQEALWMMDVLLGKGSICPSETSRYWLRDFAAIHASPPCQRHSSLRHLHGKRQYPELVKATRTMLHRSGLPWVIENVQGARLDTPTVLCGSMFGLGAMCSDGAYHQLRRHRHFESSMLLVCPPCSHAGRPVGVYGDGGGNANRGHLPGVNGFTGKAHERRAAMGINWMSRGELSEAIPPAYTEYLGKQLLNAIGGASA